LAAASRPAASPHTIHPACRSSTVRTVPDKLVIVGDENADWCHGVDSFNSTLTHRRSLS
jgi:hypothetical protein